MADVRELLTIVIPTHNERATLREAVERLLKAQLPLPLEVLIVDDGSTDGSRYEVADLIAEGRVRYVCLNRRMGKGAAVRVGIRLAGGDVLAILDADLEYDPRDLPTLLEPILQGETRVAYGTRAFGAHTAFSFWYVIGNKVINLWASLLFDTWLSDLSTCLKVAHTELWRELDLQSNGFEFDAEATSKFLRRGERIFEAPVSYRARPRSAGKKVRPRDGLRHLWTIAKVRLGG